MGNALIGADLPRRSRSEFAHPLTDRMSERDSHRCVPVGNHRVCSSVTQRMAVIKTILHVRRPLKDPAMCRCFFARPLICWVTCIIASTCFISLKVNFISCLSSVFKNNKTQHDGFVLRVHVCEKKCGGFVCSRLHKNVLRHVPRHFFLSFFAFQFIDKEHKNVKNM